MYVLRKAASKRTGNIHPVQLENQQPKKQEC